MLWLDASLKWRLNVGVTPSLDKRIRIVQIDDQDLIRSGTASEYAATAQAVRQIGEHGARVLVLDALYLHGTPAEQQTVLEAVAQVVEEGCQVVVSVAIFPGENGAPVLRWGLPISPGEGYQFGVVNMGIDPDRLWRRYALTWEHDGKTLPSLALAAFAAALPDGLELSDGQNPGELTWVELSEDFSRTVQRTANSRPKLINFRHSFYDHTLDDREGLGRRIWNLSELDALYKASLGKKDGGSPFYGSTVFLGYGAGLDEKPTSMGAQEPGLFLHATALSDLLQNEFLERAPLWVDLALFALTSVVAGVSFRIRQLPFLLLIGTVVAAIPLGASFILIWKTNTVVAAVSCTILWILLLSIELVRRSVDALRERSRIEATMSGYFSEKVLQQVLSNPFSTEPKEAQLTVCLTDIRNFTRLTEALEPKDMFEFLGRAFDIQTRAVLHEDGSLQHFWGDQFIAYWGAPDPQEDAADRAWRAVLDFTDCIRQFSEEFEKGNGLPFGIGVGLHSGRGLVGNIGSESYFDYNIFGEVVNVTARVESLTKLYGVHILATREFCDELGEVPLHRVVDRVLVAGASKAVELIELRPREGDSPAYTDLCAAYSKAREHYEGGRFGEASKEFSLVAERYSDSPSREMAKRSANFVDEPPESWAGIYQFVEKR